MRSTLISGLVLLGFVALVAPVAKLRFNSHAQPPAPPASVIPAAQTQQTPRTLPQLGSLPSLPATPVPAPQGIPQPRIEPTSFNTNSSQTAQTSAQNSPPVAINPNMPGWAGRLEKDRANLAPLTRQMLLTTRRGADWLARMNGVKGLFSPGIEPAVREESTDTGWLGQISAAWSLNRAAQAFGDQKYEARALQAMLCALEETTPDPTDPKARHTSVPQFILPRIQGTALLALALVDQPSPPSDMLNRSEEMVNYLRRESQEELISKTPANPPANLSAQRYLVAYTLLKSNKHRPANWKLELTASLLESAKGPTSAQAQPWQGLALAEWSRTQGDRQAAARLFAACDELAHWQQTKIDAAHPRQLGGFQPPVPSGKLPAGTLLPPPTTAISAPILLTLAEAATLSREMGDATLNQSLMETIDRGTQFLAQHQYTESTTQHFAEWYRPLLEGGFRDTQRGGTLSLATQQMALVAMLQSLRASAP